MKKNELRLSTLKKKLQAEVAGKGFVIWSLNKEQRDYIEGLGYTVEPFIYSIKSSRFPYYLRKTHNILNVLHFASCSGRRYVTAYMLKKDDKMILNKLNIGYKPLKFRISR